VLYRLCSSPTCKHTAVCIVTYRRVTSGCTAQRSVYTIAQYCSSMCMLVTAAFRLLITLFYAHVYVSDVCMCLYDAGAPKGLVHTTGGYLTHAGVTTRNTFDVQEVSAAALATATILLIFAVHMCRAALPCNQHYCCCLLLGVYE
jgi:hypothetical protein